MKHLPILTFLFLLKVPIFAQTKTIEIWRSVLRSEYLTAVYEPELSYVILNAQNSKFSELIDIIDVFQGSPKQMYDFLTDIEYFANTNKDIDSKTKLNQDFAGHSVFLSKTSGMMVVNIFDSAGIGYHSFVPKWITNIKSELVKYCNQNKIEYLK